jgi:CRP-like cAMP-binding protein
MQFLQNLCLAQLTPGVFDRVKPQLRPREFSAAEILFTPGDGIRDVYFLTSGAVSLVTPLEGGQTIEFGIIGRESVVGGSAALAAEADANYQAIVQVPGQGYSLDVERARLLAQEHKEFRALITRHEQLILAQAHQSSACNAVHDIEQRFSRWLLRVRDVVGSDSFRLTQELMAEMLGVRRTSVTAVAQKIQQAGVITYTRGHITIENLEGLQSCACECHRTIKAQYELPSEAPRMSAPHPAPHAEVPGRHFG